MTFAALEAVGVGWATRDELHAMKAGGAGWGENPPDGAFTFPERDGHGRIVGLSLRAVDGRKGFPSGARRGLIVPSTLKDRGEPVLIVEGASDVAACEALGLAAVGRPSNSGGADELGQLLDSIPVFVVGEDDRKADGKWPGRDGAKAVAKRLAAAWGEPVAWTLPPDGAKDIRAGLQSRVAAGLDLSNVEACKAAAGELLAGLQAGKHEAKKEKGESEAKRLTRLAGDVELWHTPDGESYATVPVNEHAENHPVRSRGFRRWLIERAYRDGGRVPNAEALQAALAVIEARAAFDGPECAAVVRVAEYDGAIWLDLADTDWRAVRIDEDGWGIESNPAVRFRRPRGSRPLPEPEHGGKLAESAVLLNIDADGMVMVKSWLLAAIRPVGPYPVLALHGPQGCGKSMATRMLRAIVDACEPATRTVPREERDLAIWADNCWIVALDNLSGLTPWLSDAFCRLSTGGGFSTRELYENREEALFSATRPVILNGIDDVATRPDLLDRCIVLQLAAIGESERRTEAELWAEFEEMRPRVLGALLDAVSAALRTVGTVKLAAAPRLADFATWAVAGEAAMGIEAGGFLAAYCGNRADANALALESSPVAGAMLDYVESVAAWSGTATALLAELDRRVSEAARKTRTWPKSPRGLTGILRRVAPNLAACGVTLTFDRSTDKKRERIIRAEKTCNPSSVSSGASNDPPGAAENAGSDGRCRTDADADGRLPTQDRPAESPARGLENGHSDGADGSDGRLCPFSADDAPGPTDADAEAALAEPSIDADIEAARALGALT